MRRLVRFLLRSPGRGPRLVLVAAFAVVVGMYWTNDDMGGDPRSPRGDGQYRPVLARGDGHMSFLIARSMAFDGDWVFDNDLRRFGDPWGEPRTRTGRKSIVHPIGAPLIWTPLLWIAQGGAVVANVLGADIQLHGYTPWHQRFVFLTSALAACLAVGLGYALARRVIGTAWAPMYGAIAVLFGTSLLYYATYMPSYPHALDAGACAGILGYWASTIGRRDLRRAATLGVLLGVAMLIRVQELALGVVVAIEVVPAAVSALRGRDPRTALRWLAFGAAVLATAVLVFTPQLLEWNAVFGSATELPQGARYTRLEAPMIGELLFSARNGWLSTTPIAYAAVIGLVLVPRPARLVAVGFLAVVVTQVYLNSTIIDWWSSSSFGQRRMCNVTLPLVVGFAALVWRGGRLAARAPRVPRAVWHALALVLVAPFLAWNLRKASQHTSGRAAHSEHSPSCCDNVPDALRGPARWIYARIGNPFQFPASALFALRHDVDVRRWDQLVGRYALVPPWNALEDAQLPRHQGTLAIGSSAADPNVAEGLSAPVLIDGRPARWTTAPRARLLVPNNMPYGQRLSLSLAPGHAREVTLRWNGDVVARAPLEGWTEVVFDLPAIELHTNELWIEADLGLAAPPQQGAAPAQPVGVAVGELRIRFLPATPQDR